MTLPSAKWNYPTAIRFGAGRVAELPEVCRTLGIARPLLVTDPALAEMAMVEHALASAGARLFCAIHANPVGAGLFCALHPNPVGGDIEAGLAAYREGGHDGVIAFGGGSALDVGKVVAFMAGQTRPLWDFEDKADWWTRADADAIAPIVAVPTTAGTGSEVGRAGVILDESEGVKKIIFHPRMLPSVVILDPELTLALPPHVTAATGMDALSHCLEAYCAPGFHPMADGIAAEGMKLIAEWLPKAVEDGTDIEARGNMLVAAAMGATAFQKGLGGMHALSHPIGAVAGTHHGLTNAVLMPYVLAFNRPAIEERIARLAGYVGLEPGFEAFLAWIVDLRRRLAIPHSLAELGIAASDIERIAIMAEADPSAAGNPRPFGAAEARQVLDSAMAGNVGLGRR